MKNDLIKFDILTVAIVLSIKKKSVRSFSFVLKTSCSNQTNINEKRRNPTTEKATKRGRGRKRKKNWRNKIVVECSSKIKYPIRWVAALGGML